MTKEQKALRAEINELLDRFLQNTGDDGAYQAYQVLLGVASEELYLLAPRICREGGAQ